MKRLASALLVLLALAGALVPAALAVIVTPDIIMVDPEADIQAAIDALPSSTGGEIHLGVGTYTLTSPLIIDRPVKLYGAGKFSTILYCASADSGIVRVTASGVTLRDLGITGPNSSGTGIGLMLRTAYGAVTNNFLAEDVYISNTASWCAAIFGPGYMDTTLAGGWSGTPVAPIFNRCTFYNNKSGGTLYSGHGVAAPTFSECNFTGQGYTRPMVGWAAADTTKADSLTAWNWSASIAAYHNYAATVLHRGHVYLCATSAAKFVDCIFQTLSTTGSDEPVLSLEDVHSARFVNPYFEAFGATNTRQQPFVTLSHASGWTFENTYVYSPYEAPFHFLRTNSNPSSRCSGTIKDFYGLQGGSGRQLTAAERTNDFVFNTALDGTGRAPIVLQNVRIQSEDSTTASAYWRDADIRTFTGYTTFAYQNILPQNTSNRFRVPVVKYDSLTTLTTAGIKPGELVYVNGGSLVSGSRGRLLMSADNSSWVSIPFVPILADTAARETWYPSPRVNDECFILSYYGTDLGCRQVFDGTAWRRMW